MSRKAFRTSACIRSMTENSKIAGMAENAMPASSLSKIVERLLRMVSVPFLLSALSGG